jgi:hypothetical protein
MPCEGRQRAAVIDRCWSIYLSIKHALSLPENFHVEFPAAVESAVMSSSLHFTVGIGGDLMLTLREEYIFNRQRLTVNRYSYNLIDAPAIMFCAPIIFRFIAPTTAGDC